VPDFALRGIVPALVTPFRQDEFIDCGRWQVIIDTLLDAGVDGLFVGGSQGEFFTLDMQERQVALRFCRQAMGARGPLYANVGCITTADTLKLAEQAEEIGVDVIVVIVPYYIKPTQPELETHYIEVCRAVPLPVLGYNYPQHGGVELLPETVARIAGRCDNFAGLKDSGGSLERAIAYRNALPDREMAVFVGGENLILPALQGGCSGAVTGCANVAPRLFVELYRAFRDGRHTDAERLQSLATAMWGTHGLHTFPAPMKAAMEMIGLGAGPCRRPVSPMPPDARAALAKVIEMLGKEGYLAHAHEPAGEREKSVPAPART
jgi:4-hydroxy-tetrahydrodipicolinate synthase